jgi:hypothetical protein
LFALLLAGLAVAAAKGPFAVAIEAQCRDHQSYAKLALNDLRVRQLSYRLETDRYAPTAHALEWSPRTGHNILGRGHEHLYDFYYFPHAHGFVGLAVGSGRMDGDVWILDETAPAPRRLANACVR